MFELHTNPNLESEDSQKFIRGFTEAIKNIVKEELDELVKIYGNDEEKIFTVLKEKFKDIADIKVDKI
jgi:hypothetical protein